MVTTESEIPATKNHHLSSEWAQFWILFVQWVQQQNNKKVQNLPPCK